MLLLLMMIGEGAIGSGEEGNISVDAAAMTEKREFFRYTALRSTTRDGGLID